VPRVPPCMGGVLEVTALVRVGWGAGLAVTALAALAALRWRVGGYSGIVGIRDPLEYGELVWEKIPFKLWLVRVGNQLVGLAITGAILAV